MTRAMPVISISRPRKTNIGTDSSSRFDMPSSMRLTTTDSGMSVVTNRYDMVAMPKAKPIGTPMATQAPTSTTKNMNRLPNTIVVSCAWKYHSTALTPATTSTAMAKSRHVVFSISRSIAMIAARLMPNRIDTAR